MRRIQPAVCDFRHLCFGLLIALAVVHSVEADDELECPFYPEAGQATESVATSISCQITPETSEDVVGAGDESLTFDAIDAYRAAQKEERLEATRVAAEKMAQKGGNVAGVKTGITATAAPNVRRTGSDN